MQEKLEEKFSLMHWLYENGVEPRYWSGKISSGDVIFSKEDTVYDEFAIHLANPYHPLEQVLEELLQVPSSRNIELDVVRTIIAKDPYLAALRLLKKVRESSIMEEKG